MGEVYKLKPEIRDFILEQKKANQALSCRGLTGIIEKKFQIKVSKSSINSVIKEAGLSMPVGRRLKKRRRRFLKPIEPQPVTEAKPEVAEELVKPLVPEQVPVNIEPISAPVEIKPELPAETMVEAEIRTEVPEETICTGAILLKAADYLMGGSYHILETIKDILNKPESDILAKIESLIYLPLFELSQGGRAEDLSELWALVGRRLSREDILSYLNDLQSLITLHSHIVRIISNTFQEVRCIKINYPDGNILYLDGQLHTVWSTPHIPFDFSGTIYNIKSYLNKYLYKEHPFILFMAPGYDTPTKEFFNFILNLDSKEKSVSKLTLYDSRFAELDVLPLEHAKRHFLVFGLWPWQFLEFRKVIKIGEFKPFNFEELKKDLYLAQIEMDLSQPNVSQYITLRGAVLKTSLSEKSRLVILSNLPLELAQPEEVTKIYLNHWPNLEEAFQDFSRKIELFTYTADSQKLFSAERINANIKADQGLSALFKYYLKALDLYVKWHFLPPGSQDTDFATINERFYSLKARLQRRKEWVFVTFLPPPGYPFLKELEYACRRVNEKEIMDYAGKRVWLEPRP